MLNKIPAINFEGLTDKALERIMQYGKPSNTLGKYTSRKFTELPYGVVRKDLPQIQKKQLHLEAVLLILNCQFGEVDISDVTANNVMSFMLWIKQQQEFILKIEQTYLSSEPDPEMLAAGINKLDEFGALSTIHTLAQGDILKHPQIESLSYFKVYEVLKYEKISRDIKKAREEMAAAKAKSKNR